MCDVPGPLLARASVTCAFSTTRSTTLHSVAHTLRHGASTGIYFYNSRSYLTTFLKAPVWFIEFSLGPSTALIGAPHVAGAVCDVPGPRLGCFTLSPLSYYYYYYYCLPLFTQRATYSPAHPQATHTHPPTHTYTQEVMAVYACMHLQITRLRWRPAATRPEDGEVCRLN